MDLSRIRRMCYSFCTEGGGETTQCICGKPLNVIASITTAMDGDERIAKIIETACDAYTAYKMDEKLKNKEI